MSIYKDLELRHKLYQRPSGGAKRQRKRKAKPQIPDYAFISLRKYRTKVTPAACRPCLLSEIPSCQTEAVRPICAKRRAADER